MSRVIFWIIVVMDYVRFRFLWQHRSPLYGVGLALVLLLSGWSGLLLLAIQRPPSNQDWIARSLAYKEAAASAQDGPRLLLLAGSNAMFGMRSPTLSVAYERPVVNLGVNAGLLLPYVLDHGLRTIRAGDIVLAPLEYHMYTWNGELSEVLVKHILESDPGWLIQRPWMAAKFSVQVPAAQLIRQIFLPQMKSMPDGIYGPHHLDEWGDQTHSSLTERSDAMHDWLYGHSPPHDYGHQQWRNSLAWKELRTFSDKLVERGACLILLPAAMAFEPQYQDDVLERTFYSDLPLVAREHGLVYVGNPRNFMYDKSLFFDTEYHLSAEGRTLHTRKLIALLGSDLQAYCPPSFISHAVQ